MSVGYVVDTCGKCIQLRGNSYMANVNVNVI
jgi:hypothetical protein